MKGYTLYRERSTLGLPKLPFYSRAHTQLRYSTSLKMKFQNNVAIKRHFNQYFLKIMHYPKEEFLEHLKQYIELEPLDSRIRLSYIDSNEKKIELMQRIRRILKVHNKNALEYIEKAYEEYLTEINQK